MRLSGSHLVALAILAGIGGWMYTGEVIIGGQVDPNATTIAEREATRTDAAFRVRITSVQPSERKSILQIRGRTEADAVVSVRAETGGTVEKRAVANGQMVKPGDLLCTIDQGIRKTDLARAKTQFNQAKADYDANAALLKRGFATKSQLRAFKSALDSATSVVATAEQEMTRTEVRATTHGQVQKPMAEIGDNLAPGGVCVTLLDADPMLFVGQVPERTVSELALGMKAEITLINGAQVGGTVRHVAQVADAKTRTFKVEIEIPNKDQSLRDGMTASSKIPLKPTLAYQLKPSWLTLADDGEIGVKVVDADNKVVFAPIKILEQAKDFMWVSGLKSDTKIITLGQNYVIDGQLVDPITEAQYNALTTSQKTADKTDQEAKL